MEVILGYLISNAPELGSLTAFHSLLLKIAEQPITLLLGDDNVVLLLTNLLQADHLQWVKQSLYSVVMTILGRSRPCFGETLVLLCRLGIVYVYCSHYIYLLALRRLYLWPLVYAFIP